MKYLENTRWSPLEIEMMLHYYCSAQPHEHTSSPANMSSVVKFLEMGLLYQTGEAMYRPTTYGLKFIETILNSQEP